MPRPSPRTTQGGRLTYHLRCAAPSDDQRARRVERARPRLLRARLPRPQEQTLPGPIEQARGSATPPADPLAIAHSRRIAMRASAVTCRRVGGAEWPSRVWAQLVTAICRAGRGAGRRARRWTAAPACRRCYLRARGRVDRCRQSGFPRRSRVLLTGTAPSANGSARAFRWRALGVVLGICATVMWRASASRSVADRWRLFLGRSERPRTSVRAHRDRAEGIYRSGRPRQRATRPPGRAGSGDPRPPPPAASRFRTIRRAPSARWGGQLRSPPRPSGLRMRKICVDIKYHLILEELLASPEGHFIPPTRCIGTSAGAGAGRLIAKGRRARLFHAAPTA